MQLSEKLKDVLNKEEQKFATSPEFAELKEFYVDMQRKGLVRKQEYSLPRLDTIGWSIRHRENLGQSR